MRLALAQLNFTIGAFEENFRKMADAVAAAREAGRKYISVASEVLEASK